MTSAITTAQIAEYQDRGWFVIRGLADAATVAAMHAEITAAVAEPTAAGVFYDQDLDARAGRTVSAQARYRKLAGFGVRSPLLWRNFFTAPRIMAIMQHLLGSEVLLKYDSVFLKPARSGSATPWHQDLMLWCDHQRASGSCWMAIDPATVENGCMRFVPGSHRGPEHEHLIYGDAVHAELPRELSAGVTGEPIELAPGDAVFWHSNLWHYSPPNTSDRNRIAIAGVWAGLSDVLSSPVVRTWRWALRSGKPVPTPDELLVLGDGKHSHPGFRTAAAAAIPAASTAGY